MPLPLLTLTGNIHDAAGGLPVDTTRSQVWLVFRDAKGLIHRVADPDSNQERHGNTKAKVNTDGSYVFEDLWPTNGATNPTGFYYELFVEVVLARGIGGNRGNGGKNVWSSGPFALTASAYVAGLDLDTPAVSATWRSAFMEQAEALLEQQIDVSQIDTSDDVVEAMVKGTAGAGPKTRAALSATIDSGVTALGSDASSTARGVVPGNLLKWRKRLAQVTAGLSDAKVLCIGDSTTYGTGATTPTQHSWPVRVVEQIGASVPAGLGLIPGPSQITNNLTLDPRWTAGAGWSLEGFGFGNASVWKSTTTAGTLTLSMPAAAGLCDSFDVYFIGNGGSGAFNVQATGGTSTVITPGTLNGVSKVTVSGKAMLGSVLTITPGSSVVRIVGIEGYSSTSKRVRVANVGVNATSSVGWTNNTTAYQSVSSITAYAPDLTVISLGLNDATTGTTAATFEANLRTLVTTAKLSGDVILMPFPPAAVGVAGQALREAYLPIYRTVADDLDCVLIDWNSRWINFDLANPLGYFFDPQHPTTLGYAEIAQAIAPILVSAPTGTAALAAIKADPLGSGLISTFDPILATAAAGVGVANRINYLRVVGGGYVSKIGLEVTTQGGNLSVAVYRNSGVGRNAAPARLVAQSASVACPAPGYAEIALSATVEVMPGDWLAICSDSATARFRGTYDNGIVNDMFKGRAAYELASGVATLPNPPAPVAGLNRCILLVGVA